MGNWTNSQNIFESEEFIKLLISKVKAELMESNNQNLDSQFRDMISLGNVVRVIKDNEANDGKIALVGPNGEKFLLTKVEHKDEVDLIQKCKNREVLKQIQNKDQTKHIFKANFKMPTEPNNLNDTWTIDSRWSDSSFTLNEEFCKNI